CWGANNEGELGTADTTSSTTPVTTQVPASIIGMTAGDATICALDFNGQVWCWGRDQNGEAFDLESHVLRAASVSPLASITSIAVGGDHACVVTARGAIECDGYNGRGELGDNQRRTQTLPVAASAFAGATQLV